MSSMVQLFQENLSGAGDLEIATPPGPGTVLRQIIVANNSASSVAFDMYHADQGQAFASDNLVFRNESIAANSYGIFDVSWGMSQGAKIGAVVPNDDLTFTGYGEVSPRKWWKLLGQIRPNNTAVTQLVVNAPGWTVRQLVVAQTTAPGRTFKLWHDQDGNGVTNTQSLIVDHALPDGTARFDLALGMGNPDAEINVQVSLGGTFTFSAYGESP